VYLPQVATETGWDKETFLMQLCHKAGLRGDDWKTATLYTFRAEVFSEAEFK
jgi:AMMECR1 domain-containing protein